MLSLLPLSVHPVCPHLILLIGLPGSGKSTIAAKLLQQNSRRRVVSTDAIRAQLFGDETAQGAWLKVRGEVERQFCQLVAQTRSGEVSEVVYDATNAVRKVRRDAIDLARGCGFTYLTGLWLNPPLATCLTRNQTRDRQVPLDVILAMQRALIGAPPSLAEGFDRLVQVRGREAD